MLHWTACWTVICYIGLHAGLSSVALDCVWTVICYIGLSIVTLDCVLDCHLLHWTVICSRYMSLYVVKIIIIIMRLFLLKTRFIRFFQNYF